MSTNNVLNESRPGATINWSNGTLLDGSAVQSGDWFNRLLRDSYTTKSVDWDNHFLLDLLSGGILSVDYGNRQLFYSDGTTIAYDWGSGAFFDASNNSSLSVTARQLADSTSHLSMNWENHVLYDTNGGGNLSLDYANRLLIASDGSNTVDWDNGYLLRSTVPVVSWGGLSLADSTGNQSINWDSRILVGPSSYNQLDWSVSGYLTALSANLKIQGIQVVEGTGNAYQGVATLSSGTVTVSTSIVSSTSRIQLTGQDNNVTGALRVNSRTTGSFDIVSSNSGDSGVVAWLLTEPA